jgi:hypothetical protein
MIHYGFFVHRHNGTTFNGELEWYGEPPDLRSFGGTLTKVKVER